MDAFERQQIIFSMAREIVEVFAERELMIAGAPIWTLHKMKCRMGSLIDSWHSLSQREETRVVAHLFQKVSEKILTIFLFMPCYSCSFQIQPPFLFPTPIVELSLGHP